MGKLIELDGGILKFVVYEDNEPLDYALDIIDTLDSRKWCLNNIGKKVEIKIEILVNDDMS